MRSLVSALYTEWKSVDLQINAADIGPLISMAIVAAIGNGAAFRRGREFAAFVGFVPRQHSTGSNARLPGISRRSNSYLIKMPIQHREFIGRLIMLPTKMTILRLSIAEFHQDILVV
jgi:transposase